MSTLYGIELDKSKKIKFETKFHELWAIGGTIRLKPIKDIRNTISPWCDSGSLEGIYLTTDLNGKLVRCGIVSDVVDTLRRFIPWQNEYFYDFHIADNYTNIRDMREFKQELKRLQSISLL